MESPVLERFKKSVDYLLEHKLAKNKKEIATTLGVTASYFSEILNNRIKISGDLLHKYLNNWPVNPSYIFSISDKIPAYNEDISPTPDNCKMCLEKERVIEQQQVAIEALKEANTQLRHRLEEKG